MKPKPIEKLVRVMARLRSPTGCPWDREQNHRTLRFHAVEEVYELLDAIEAGDDLEMAEELGDLLLQVVFHCQLARERGAFDFDEVCRRITDKLIRRHPHVFGQAQARSVAAVWKQWEEIKRREKAGTRHERPSAFDGIPRHLPALLQAQKLLKRAGKAGLIRIPARGSPAATRKRIGEDLFALVAAAHEQGWSAEELLRSESRKREKLFRRAEKRPNDSPARRPHFN